NRAEGAQAEQVTQRLRVPGNVDILVADRIDVAPAPLHEQGDRPFAQVVFDDAGGETGDVGRVTTAGNSLDRMTGEIVHDCQRPSVFPVDPQDPDLGIHRAHFGNFGIGGQ